MAASTAKVALPVLTMDEMLKAVVFQKFHYRPQHSVEFGSAVLVASALKSHADMETKPSKV